VHPRISLVTVSFNEAEALARTIESVRALDDPDVEQIVVDRMSSDATVDVLARAPYVRTIRQSFTSSAEAITMAVRSATGDILGLLSPGAALAPGALLSVTSAVAPEAGRHLVVGRCQFVDGQGRSLGLEHRMAVDDPDRILEIWKGLSVPLASTFWTRVLWERCGPFDAHHDDRLMAYEFLCRASRSFTIHALDSVLSEVAMPASGASAVLSADLEEQAIAVSRRYWGTPRGASYWRLAVSRLRSRLNRRGRAVMLLRRGRSRIGDGRWMSGALCGAAGALLAPDVLPDVVAVPALQHAAARMRHGRAASGMSAALPAKATLYADGWAGPDVTITRRARRGCTALRLAATRAPGSSPGPLSIDAEVDGRALGARMAGAAPDFHVAWPVDSLAPGAHQVRLRASSFVIPARDLGTADHRQLSYWVASIDFVEKA